MSYPAAELRELAEKLAGEAPSRIDAARGGGNSRVYRVVTAGGREFALKRYPPGDARDRLGQEYEALEFLRAAGFDNVPSPVARDAGRGAALFSWLHGTRVEERQPGDVAQLANFVRAAHGAARLPAAQRLRPAAEAVTGGGELLRQLEQRLARLESSRPEHAGLHRILTEIRAELRSRTLPQLPQLPRERQTLSPSDIGFHNALRGADGTLAFVDFEYFGWDDPAKLVSDVLWHPGHTLAPHEALEFRARAADIYSADPDFEVRLATLFPFFGLRWALIVLNEFLSSDRERREFAGKSGDRLEIEERQLAKARDLVERVRAGIA